MTELITLKTVFRAALTLALTLPVLGAAAVVMAPTPAVAQARGHALPQRGDYLPADLLKSGPNVDPAAAHLRRPPAGYGWFSLTGVFVLASVSTGLIVEVVAP
ncbi:MAG: hypothetical protein JWO72_356 [Caulobacteraceae bacterium]|jgi:hypothetical protein|nr:hypothetical protein [Caulobacteraceae bacterium]